LLYKNSLFKRMIQQINNQSEKNNNPEEPQNLWFAPIIIKIITFFISSQIIDNIINTSVLRDQNFHQWQCGILVT